MRDIKFRAFNKESGMMRGFDLDWHKVNSNAPLSYTEGMHKLWNEDTIFLQYTGLSDKNGVEIYGGFRCKFKYMEKLHEHVELVGVFNYNLDELRYEIDIEGNEHYKCLSYISNGQMYDFEVIGNIYENPELLEVK